MLQRSRYRQTVEFPREGKEADESNDLFVVRVMTDRREPLTEAGLEKSLETRTDVLKVINSVSKGVGEIVPEVGDGAQFAKTFAEHGSKSGAA